MGKPRGQMLQNRNFWLHTWHDPVHLTCSSHKKKEVSLPAGTEAVPPCLTNDMNWFSGVEEAKADDLSGVYSLLPGMSFPSLWSHPDGRRVVKSPLTETVWPTGLSDTVPHISRFRHLIQHQLLSSEVASNHLLPTVSSEHHWL